MDHVIFLDIDGVLNSNAWNESHQSEISGGTEQIRRQMIKRRGHEGGLFYPEGIERSNTVIRSRKLLPNEVMIDVAGKSKEEVLEYAIRVIDAHKPVLDYEYELDDEHNYLSWVQSRHLTY